MPRFGVTRTLFAIQTLPAPTPDPIPQPVDSGLARTATWAVRSPEFNVPNNLDRVYLELTADAGGFENPAEWIMLAVEYSTDSGTTWQESANITTLGGVRGRDGGRPGLWVDIAPRVAGQQRLARSALLSLAGTPRVGVIGDAV
jgi:hypothetical protein